MERAKRENISFMAELILDIFRNNFLVKNVKDYIRTNLRRETKGDELTSLVLRKFSAHERRM